MLLLELPKNEGLTLSYSSRKASSMRALLEEEAFHRRLFTADKHLQLR